VSSFLSPDDDGPGQVGILYVEDNPALIDTLERRLENTRPDWTLHATDSEHEALALAESDRVHIALVPIDSGAINGRDLLQHIARRRPGIPRIALTQGASPDVALGALGVAHQFVPHSGKPQDVITAIDRVLSLREILANDRLRAALAGIQRLPSAPTLYLKLASTLNDPYSNASQVADLLRSDPGISAQILRVSNSALFSRGQAITNLQGAVARLGVEMVQRIALAAETFSKNAVMPGVDVHQVQLRGLLASRLAEHIVTDREQAANAATACILADVGLLLPCQRLAAMRCFGEPNDDDMPPEHAQAGAYLLGLWGLPTPVVQAVAYRHAPARVDRTRLGIVGTVHVATALASGEDVDEGFLEAIGLHSRLDQWRKLREGLGGAIGGEAERAPARMSTKQSGHSLAAHGSF